MELTRHAHDSLGQKNTATRLNMSANAQQRTRRILFVGMVDSPHAARWIHLIADQGWELHFFPVHLATPHPLMRNITVHQPWIRIRPRYLLHSILRRLCWRMDEETIERRLPLPVASYKTSAVLPIPVMRPFDRILVAMRSERLGESDKRISLPYGPQVLARLIKKLKPDLIHSMEFQHAGYNVLRAKELMGQRKFPKWLATNWGSDIYYYQRFPDHYQQISRLLKQIDYYSCECTRDVAIARDMGMVAEAMPVFPNTGGFDIEAITALRSNMQPSKRRMIMVKGYQHFAGRVLTALDALVKCADDLRDYRVVIFSASSMEVNNRVAELRLFYGINITILPYTSHDVMLKYFAHARIYLGVSISDAISTSMLEAMAMGAFPIQTTTSCCEEWNDDGVSGFHIPPDDVEVIADRIRRAISDDALVDSAAMINWQTVRDRLDQRVLQKREIDVYDKIFADVSSVPVEITP